MQERPEKPLISWLTHQIWKGCCDLEDFLPCFKGLTNDITVTYIMCTLGRIEISLNPENWDGYGEQVQQDPSDDEEKVEAFVSWDDRLTEFQKLCLVKCLKEEKV